jgi:hypothetical protein
MQAIRKYELKNKEVTSEVQGKVLTCFVFQLRVILHIECVLTQIIVVDSE